MRQLHQLFIDFKKSYDSFRREVLCNIVIVLDIPRKLASLIEMYRNETCDIVQVGKHLFGMFVIKIVRIKEVLYRHCLSTSFKICHYVASSNPEWLGMKYYSSSFVLC
jgi:hypothetical protein